MNHGVGGWAASPTAIVVGAKVEGEVGCMVGCEADGSGPH